MGALNVANLISNLNKSSIIFIEITNNVYSKVSYYINGKHETKHPYTRDLNWIIYNIRNPLFIRSDYDGFRVVFIKYDAIVDISDTQIKLKYIQFKHEYVHSIHICIECTDCIKTSIRQYKLNQVEELTKL